MDELTLAHREFEFDQKEFTLTKKQFYLEQKQLTQQVQLDKQQFNIAKEQFELEKITFQHELQQQRDLLSKQQLAIDQQKQHLQQHLQLFLIPSSNNGCIELLSESVQDKEEVQKSHNLFSSSSSSLPSSIFTDVLEGMINKSNNHLNHEIKHYYQLTKQLHNVVNHLKRKEKKIKQREMKSQECLRMNYHIRHHLVCYLKFMKSRHDMIINTMKCNTKLKKDTKSLKKTVEELNVTLDKVYHHQDNIKFKLDTTPLHEKQIIVNNGAWELRSKQNELKYLSAMKEYNKKKVGKEPEIDEVQAAVMIQLVNLNKNMHVSCDYIVSNRPLLSRLYRIPESTTLPLFGHFFKKDYDNGTIPKLTDDLKLFFSSQHIDNGRWIQFHGPDKEVDGSTWDNPITLFSLLNPNNVGSFKSTDDDDRCELSKDECRKQHKETDKNYESYHSSPLTVYTSQHQISIKWE